MGFLSTLTTLFSRTSEPAACKGGAASVYENLVVDLGVFRCGHTVLGEPVALADFYSSLFDDSGLFEDKAHGFEVGQKKGRLDYIFLTMAAFKGKFAKDGALLPLDASTTMQTVLSVFGEPYWHDDDKDESILFYEDGTVEVQFEFPDKVHLGIITILRDPIMAKPEQRKAYRVTKAWPPQQ